MSGLNSGKFTPPYLLSPYLPNTKVTDCNNSGSYTATDPLESRYVAQKKDRSHVLSVIMCTCTPFSLSFVLVSEIVTNSSVLDDKVCVVGVRSMDKDEPEEGEIQDDDGSLEDVSSDENTLPICCAKTSETSCDKKYPISHTVQTDFVTHSSRVPNRRVRKACKRKGESFSSTTEGSKPRLNVKYREGTNKTSNVYHVTLNPMVVDDHRKDDHLVNITSEHKPIRSKQSDKDEDIVQEKENRHDSQKETKVKRKCRRKRRRSDSKIDSNVGNQQVGPGHDGKKEYTLTKFGTVCKSSHSKKRHVSPKREKHRYSKKKDGGKCWSRRLPDAVKKDGCNEVEGNSLLKRLQQMMTVNVSARKERIIKRKDEENVSSQELEHGLGENLLPSVDTLQSDTGNRGKGSSDMADILKESYENHLSAQSSEDVVVLHDTKKPEPLVITIEDSDSEPHVSVNVLEHDSAGKENEDHEVKISEGEKSAKGADEDEDLVQLRLLALQSNRRKVTSDPRAEDDEVMQLRLAALKSAILKKCEVRKQRGVTLKSNKTNTLTSPAVLDFESISTRYESGQESQKPEVTSVEALHGEPDETTTLVDMELSHTDDESGSQNEIITNPISADIPMPGGSASTILHVMHEDCNIQNVPCNNEPLLTVHEYKPVDFKQIQKEQNSVSTWNTTTTVCRSPESARFDVDACQVSGIYGSNVHIFQVGYSDCHLPFAASSLPQQQLHNELYQSNNSSDFVSGDLEGVCSEPIISPVDPSVSPAFPSSFVSSNLNCQTDTILGSRVEPQVMSGNSSMSRIVSDSLKTDSITKVGVNVPKTSSVAATEDSHSVIVRTETDTQKTDSLVYTQFCTVDSTTVSCLNWDRNMERHLPSRNSVLFKKSSFAAPVKTVGMIEDTSMISSTCTESFSTTTNSQNVEVEGIEAGVLFQSHNNVSVPSGEITEHKSDCNVEESSNELENIDLSNMIVLDEVGRCSSPEAKVEEVSNEQVVSKKGAISEHCGQISTNMDEDEEVLRAKVLTTLVRKPSTPATCLVNEIKSIKGNEIPGPSEVSSVQHTKTSTMLLSVLPTHTLTSCNLQVVDQSPVSQGEEQTPSKLIGSFDKLKGSTKITWRLPSKKVEHSHHNLCNSNENVIRERCWKKSLKKGLSGINIKQNPSHIKQVKVRATALRNDPDSMAAKLKTSLVHCRLVGKNMPRSVFCPRAPRPATLQVTVPTDSVHDEEHRKKIAGSLVSSAGSVQLPPPQRFVIHLGEDSDSPDEDGRTQQQPSQALQRSYITTKNFSVPLLAHSPSTTRVVSCDRLVNCNSNISSLLLPQLHHPVSHKQNAAADSTQSTLNSRIPVDFEKGLDLFLKQARKSQEARAKKTVTPNRCVRGKSNLVASSVTPLAVRHLPSSQQEEYRRLKKQIAELEEQRKRSQEQKQQQHLSKNMSSTKSSSLPSCPDQSAAASGSVKLPLKIVLTNTSSEKREVLQNSLTSASLGIDASSTVKIKQQYPPGLVQEFRDIKASDRQTVSTVALGVTPAALNKRSGNSFSVDAVLLKTTQNNTGATSTVASLNLASRKHQKRTVKENKILDSVVRKEEKLQIDIQEPLPVNSELHNVCDVHKRSSSKCDCLSSEGINVDESLEQMEAQLAKIEHQLLSKRYEVVDDLTSMATLLHQIERERTAEEECLSELRRTQEALQRIEERLVQQKELLSNMRNDISESHQRVARGRAECISLSKNCLSLGVSVKGHLYKVPAGGAELMNLKLQQVAAQTRRMSRKKEYLEDSEENPSGSVVTAITCLKTAGQDKAEIRTASIVVESSKDTLISYNVCASPTMAVNGESEIIPMLCTEHDDASISKTNTSHPKHTCTSEVLGFKLSQQSYISSTPLSLSATNVTASKSDISVLVPKDSDTETRKNRDSVPAVTDNKRACMGVSEGLEMVALGMDCSSKETAMEHISVYRSPLEHFHSKRQGTELEVGTIGDSKAGDGWSGPLDPLAILCPYELMGSCQDEECCYQHHTKTAST